MNNDDVSNIRRLFANALVEAIPTNVIAEALPATTGGNEFITIAEACRLTKFSRHTIRRWCKSGKIKYAKFSKAKSGAVRIFRSSLEAYLKSLCQKEETEK